MKQVENLKLFEDTPVPRAVMQLCIPTVISSLVMIVYNLVDTFFVGMLNDPIENTAVTLAAPVLLAFNAVHNLFGVGASSMLSRALGQKDYDTAYKSAAFGFYGAVLSGVLLSVFCTIFKIPLLHMLGTVPENMQVTGTYLFWTVTCGSAPAIVNVVLASLVKAEGNTLHASIGSMSGCFLNMILDPIFILPQGLGMGAAGAGCATFLSNCAACLYFMVLLYVRRKKSFVCLNPAYFTFKKTIVVSVCAVGIPAAIQNLLNVTGMTVLNNFTAAFSSDAVAAMGIAQKINMIPMYVALGFSQGIMPLIGYNYASKNYKRMKKVLFFTAAITFVFMSLTTLGYYIGSRELITIFMKHKLIVNYGSRFLRGMCLATPFLAIDFLAVSVFQACGMGGKSLVFALLRKLILEIPALYILNSLYPLYGLAYAQPIAEFILAIAAIVVIVRMFQKELSYKSEEKTV